MLLILMLINFYFCFVLVVHYTVLFKICTKFNTSNINYCKCKRTQPYTTNIERIQVHRFFVCNNYPKKIGKELGGVHMK